MMYLVQGQENTPYILNFACVGSSDPSPSLDKGGHLVDPEEISFKILDPDGDDLFPGGGDFEVLEDDEGRLGVGRFYAYDTSFGVGWTPAGDADLGTYSIVWKWRLTSSGEERTWTQRFQVEDASLYSGQTFGTYLCPAQVREEGITVAELPAARLEKGIRLAQSYIERMTQNVFRPVYSEYVLNGGHHAALPLRHPIIGIESLFANNSSTALSTSSYAVAFERVDRQDFATPSPDARRNPFLRFRMSGSGSVFDSLISNRGRFLAGVRSNTVRGVFGFLESDGTCPEAIQNAMLRLVSKHADMIAAGSAGEGAVGPITSETVDRHSITYSVTGSAAAKQSLALAGAREVEEAIAMYKAPISIGAPAPSRVWDDGFLR